MYSEKYLLFTTGGGSSDPLNWDSSEAAVYSSKDFRGMKPTSARTIDLFFHTDAGREIVKLNVKNGTHVGVMTAIGNALVSSKQAVISVADVDNGNFIHKAIYGVTITAQKTFLQKITGNTKTLINAPGSNYSSCMISNVDASDPVNCKLHLTSQVGTDIIATLVYSAETVAATTASDTVTVDNGSGGASAADSDAFLNERVYKADGTFIGICTAVTTTLLTFSGGLENAVTDNDILYVGTRYVLLNNLTIPANTVLKLESDEISFDNTLYNLYVTSGDSGGQLRFKFNY